MSDGGFWRSNYESLKDDPDFQELSTDAQAVFQTLKLVLGQYGIGVFYPSLLREYHRRATDAQLTAALRELEDEKPSGSPGWLRHERHVYWIRNALRFDPTLSMNNPNHAKGALKHARSLPAATLAREFIDYYGLEGADLVPSGRPPRKRDQAAVEIPPKSHLSASENPNTETMPKPIPTSTPSSPPSAPVESTEEAIAAVLPADADRVALSAVVHAVSHPPTWLAEIAAALNGMGGHARLTPQQLGVALRDFTGTNDVLEKPKLGLFRVYMRNASKPPPENGKRPPPRGRGRTPPQQFTYEPTNSADDVKL